MHLNGSQAEKETETQREGGRQRGCYGNLCIIGTEIVNWQMPVEIFVHFVHFRLLRAAQHVDKKLHNYGCPDKRSDQLDRKCCLYTSRKRREAGKQESREAGKQSSSFILATKKAHTDFAYAPS